MHVSAMTNARHAQLAGQLFAACGGVTKIVAEKACRLDKTRLYEFADERADAFMPADVIADLEAWCGEPIYSRGLVEHRPAQVHAENLLNETMEMTEISARLMGLVREATADKTIDTAERRKITRGLDELEQQLREMRAASERVAS